MIHAQDWAYFNFSGFFRHFGQDQRWFAKIWKVTAFLWTPSLPFILSSDCLKILLSAMIAEKLKKTVHEGEIVTEHDKRRSINEPIELLLTIF